MKLFIFQYVDPGTGSLLLQLIFSFLIGAGFYVITLRRRLKHWFRQLLGDSHADASPPPEKIEPKEN